MELPKPRFQVLPQGYVFSEVDGLINRINAALASGQRVPPGVVDATTFTLSTNSGYSVDDVATWLDDAFEVLSNPDPRPFPTGSAASADQQIGRPEPAQPGRHDAYDTVVASAGNSNIGSFVGNVGWNMIVVGAHTDNGDGDWNGDVMSGFSSTAIP